MSAFYTLHRDLPREGPGEAADVAWAAGLCSLRGDADIADIACGPGSDIAALLHAAPGGHVMALDKTAHFVDVVRSVWGTDPRVMVLRADMARIANNYDMIWCAGAVYVIGVTQALQGWRKSLKPGGVVAFSEACWFTDTPSAAALANWADYPAMTDAAGIAVRVRAAGYDVLGTRRLSDAAWEDYYAPMEARIAALRHGADADLAQVLNAAEAEIATWRACRVEFGYVLMVVQPV
jgi:trans-aconitate methyltransferase